MPHEEHRLVEQEESMNDTDLEWPSAHIIAKLPPDWFAMVEVCESSDKESGVTKSNGRTGYDRPKSTKKRRANTSKRNHKFDSDRRIDTQPLDKSSNTSRSRKSSTCNQQPYYLNHVRGSTRIRQASQRIGAAIGSIFASHLICHLSESVTLRDIGLMLPSTATHNHSFWQEISLGCIIGSSIVTIIFLVEIVLGWIKPIGFFRTVVPNENFSVNFLWDVLFHVGVSINEEVMLRGWMFVLGCRGILLMVLNWFDDATNAATFSVIASIILQSSLFSFLHVHSPGSTRVSLLNLFLGGIAASINVMVTGVSLWLGIGWHFGWNIVMGHVVGRSTSGIPMSCACIDVIPRPKTSAGGSFEVYHGGTFGPEQGILAPLAYLLGIIIVIYAYGFDKMIVWRDELVLYSI